MKEQVVRALPLVIGVLVISTAAVLIRLCEDAGPAVIATARMGIATLVLLPVSAIVHGKRLVTIPRHCWVPIILAGLFLGAHFFFWMSSLKETSVASSVVIVATNPIFVGVASYFLFKERIGRRLVYGIVLAAAGGSLIAAADMAAGAGSLRGDLLSLLGAVMASCYFLAGRRVRRDVDILSYILPVYGIAAMLLFAIALSRGEPLRGYRTTTYIWFVLLAIGPQLLGHSSLNWGLRHLSATFITICVLGEPIGASVIAYFALHEKLTFLQAAGGVLILVGIFFAARAQLSMKPAT
jgi:drug/metabolite transporter (DMT)-like permease